MKKKYVKPVIMFESFTLTQSIAYNCGNHKADPTGDDSGPTMQDKNVCGWYDGFDVIWLSTPACSDEYPADAEIEEGCYHNAGGGVSIFGSV